MLVMGRCRVKSVEMNVRSIMESTASLENCKPMWGMERVYVLSVLNQGKNMSVCDATCSNMAIGDGNSAKKEGGVVHATGE